MLRLSLDLLWALCLTCLCARPFNVALRQLIVMTSLSSPHMWTL